MNTKTLAATTAISILVAVSATTAQTTNTNANAQTNTAAAQTTKKPKQKTLTCPTNKPGLLLALHGATGTGPALDGPNKTLTNTAKTHNLKILLPTARETTGRIWDINPGSPDWKNLTNLVKTTIANNCINPKKVYVIGHSMGAMMTSVLACTTTLFHGASVLAGIITPPQKCKQPINIHAIHSKDDPLVYLQGGLFKGIEYIAPTWARNQTRLQYMQKLAKNNKCTTKTTKPGSNMGKTYQTHQWTCPNNKTQIDIYDNILHAPPPNWAQNEIKWLTSK